MALFFRRAGAPRDALAPATAALVEACDGDASRLALAASFVDDCCGDLASFRGGGDARAHLTYGEIDVPSLARVLRAAEALRPVRRFADVGAGRGAALLAAAALLPDAAACAGVELDAVAAAAAAAALDRAADHAFRGCVAADISVARADALEDRRWGGADLVYCCWTAFPEDLRRAFAAAFAAAVAPGAVLAVTTHALPDAAPFRLEATLSVACSWAPDVPCYLYRRT